jgi:hypothetical protein
MVHVQAVHTAGCEGVISALIKDDRKIHDGSGVVQSKPARKGRREV